MILEFIFRWAHVLFGITWIGMLYYFNFVQTEYFKEAEADAKADAIKKLASRRVDAADSHRRLDRWRLRR